MYMLPWSLVSIVIHVISITLPQISIVSLSSKRFLHFPIEFPHNPYQTQQPLVKSSSRSSQSTRLTFNIVEPTRQEVDQVDPDSTNSTTVLWPVTATPPFWPKHSIAHPLPRAPVHGLSVWGAVLGRAMTQLGPFHSLGPKQGNDPNFFQRSQCINMTKNSKLVHMH